MLIHFILDILMIHMLRVIVLVLIGIIRAYIRVVRDLLVSAVGDMDIMATAKRRSKIGLAENSALFVHDGQLERAVLRVDEREDEGEAVGLVLVEMVPLLLRVAAEDVAARGLDDGERGALVVALGVERGRLEVVARTAVEK